MIEKKSSFIDRNILISSSFVQLDCTRNGGIIGVAYIFHPKRCFANVNGAGPFCAGRDSPVCTTTKDPTERAAAGTIMILPDSTPIRMARSERSFTIVDKEFCARFAAKDSSHSYIEKRKVTAASLV